MSQCVTSWDADDNPTAPKISFPSQSDPVPDADDNPTAPKISLPSQSDPVPDVDDNPTAPEISLPSQFDPVPDVDDNPTASEIFLPFQSNPDFLMPGYEVAELILENGQISTHGFGFPPVPAKPATAAAAANPRATAATPYAKFTSASMDSPENTSSAKQCNKTTTVDDHNFVGQSGPPARSNSASTVELSPLRPTSSLPYTASSQQPPAHLLNRMSSRDQSLIPVGSNQIPPKVSPIGNEEEKLPESEPIDVDEETPKGSISPNKKGLKSKAWDHFHRQNIDGKWKAVCKACKKKLGGDIKMGTTHLHDHIRRCPLRKVKGPKQSSIMIVPNSSSSGFRGESIMVENNAFNQEIPRKELATMIILHEYPLSMVEDIGFRRFTSCLQPLFKSVSHNTIKNDILKIYECEKTKTKTMLAKLQSRIAITTDMWTSSNQNKSYMAITAHFIDDSWCLQTRIVRFIYVPTPCTAEVLCDSLVQCLSDWNLDRKLSTITIDNWSTNDAMIQLIFAKLPSSQFILGGSLFHMQCCAYILNLIVKDGLSIISEAIERIRSSVAYWSATPKREEKFKETCCQLNVSYSKKLAPDCRTRWNSTCLMLSVAISYQKVFDRMKLRDPHFKNIPTEDDWKMAKEICEKLELFYSMTELFSGTLYPTTNICFPKICEIKLSLKEWLQSSNFIIRDMASNMIDKFDKYWDKINAVMIVGTILDPRYKMMLLNYFFPLMYGDKAPYEIQRVQILCQDLVNEYSSKLKGNGQPSDSTISTITDLSSMGRMGDWKCNFAQFVHQKSVTTSVKSELDFYLEESILPTVSDEKFDILAWWKSNGLKYPILQRIAKDFLGVPISTIASELAFSTSDQYLSAHHNKLHSDTLEALMCTKDWLWRDVQGSLKDKPSCCTMNKDMDVDKASSIIEG